MSTLADILTQFPDCRVTITSRSTPRRPKPQLYDEKVTKSRGTLIRLHQYERLPSGRVIGQVVRNGRPLWEWVRESDLDEYDRKQLEFHRKMKKHEESQ